MKNLRRGAALLVPLLALHSGPPDRPQREIREVRDHIVKTFSHPPIRISDSTTVRRVERRWGDEIRLHLENGHTLRLKVELVSY